MPDSAAPAALPARADYGTGCYRRRIVLAAGKGEVRGELGDDFHHFGVRLVHDGREVTQLEGEDVRVPWTTCPGAVEPLRRMRGAPLTRSVLEAFRYTAPREQCTHLHDLACLAVVHAARVVAGGAPRRRYDVTLPDRVKGGAVADLERDGTRVLRWVLQGQQITHSEPAGWGDLRLGGKDFHRRLRDARDADLVEGAWLFQRAIFVGIGRRHDFEAMPDAGVFAPVVGAACHSFAPERVAQAHRVRGSVRDFSASPDGILDR